MMYRRITKEVNNRTIYKKKKDHPGMLNTTIPKLLPVGAIINCADHSGAKTLRIIGYKKYQGTNKRYAHGGIGSVCVVTVVNGPINLKKQCHYAVIIRQKFPITRKTGLILGKVAFHDNAAVLIERDVKGKGVKNLIKMKKVIAKGPVAREIHQINKKFESITGNLR